MQLQAWQFKNKKENLTTLAVSCCMGAKGHMIHVNVVQSTTEKF
jgi:hypothetical protein